MNKLTIKNITIDGQAIPVVDSKEVAEILGKEHKNLLRDIKGYIDILEGSKLSSRDFFIADEYLNSQNKMQPCYQLTKKGCDMVANKMSGKKGVLFSAEYVTRFDEMEKQILQQMPKLSKELQAIFMIDGKQQELEQEIIVVRDEVKDLKDNLPLLGVDCDEITSLIKKICTKVTGYETPAYKDKSLRGRVYSDIYGQVKREFQVKSYKAIKRSQIELAKGIITNYKAPKALLDEIIQVNNQVDFEEVI